MRNQRSDWDLLTLATTIFSLPTSQLAHGCTTSLCWNSLLGMGDVDIDESKAGELVPLVPRHLVLYHSLNEADAMIVTKEAKKICRARWPKAYIKIAAPNSELEDWELQHFIRVEYQSRVGDEDFDMSVGNTAGAFFRAEVVEEILWAAMSAAMRR